MESERKAVDTAAAWAEIIGAVAVVVSLLYVGGEVRRNTVATQAATYQEMISESNAYLLALAMDSVLTDIVVRGETDYPSLSVAEARRFFSYNRIFWRNMENAFVQHRTGVLADPEWRVYHDLACAQRLRLAGSWEVHRDAMNSDFELLMDEC